MKTAWRIRLIVSGRGFGRRRNVHTHTTCSEGKRGLGKALFAPKYLMAVCPLFTGSFCNLIQLHGADPATLFEFSCMGCESTSRKFRYLPRSWCPNFNISGCHVSSLWLCNVLLENIRANVGFFTNFLDCFNFVPTRWKRFKVSF